jgi:hypothetical protein
VDFSTKRIGGRLKVGAALGLGLEGGVEYYIEPEWLADGLRDLGSEAVEAGSDLARGAVDTGVDTVGSTVRMVGGWFS